MLMNINELNVGVPGIVHSGEIAHCAQSGGAQTAPIVAGAGPHGQQRPIIAVVTFAQSVAAERQGCCICLQQRSFRHGAHVRQAQFLHRLLISSSCAQPTKSRKNSKIQKKTKKKQ